jgi:hypothetical protein
VVSLNLTADKIESPGLSGNNNTQRQGDGSFDSELQSARHALEEKKTYSLFAPWAEVQKVFNLIPLEFKFDFNANKIGDEVKKNNPEPEKVKTDAVKPEDRKEIKVVELPKETAVFKIAKEEFIKNAPLPVAPYVLPNAYITTAKFMTKSDLKIIIDDIVEKIELMKVGRRTELNMALNYENLGDLLLNLTLKNGMVSIQISAAQSETKRSLEQNLSELESALKSAKINLKDLTVLEVKNGDQSKHTD